LAMLDNYHLAIIVNVFLPVLWLGLRG
jgi:hypothetical protein